MEENESLEKSIERIMNIEPIEFSKINFDNLAAIGLWSNHPYRSLFKKDGKWMPRDNDAGTWETDYLYLFDKPLIAREDYIGLANKQLEQQKIRLTSRNKITLGMKISQKYKSPRTRFERIKTKLGYPSYEWDCDNPDYSFIEVGYNPEKELWSSDKVIPIYKGNEDYERILKDKVNENL